MFRWSQSRQPRVVYQEQADIILRWLRLIQRPKILKWIDVNVASLPHFVIISRISRVTKREIRLQLPMKLQGRPHRQFISLRRWSTLICQDDTGNSHRYHACACVLIINSYFNVYFSKIYCSWKSFEKASDDIWRPRKMEINVLMFACSRFQTIGWFCFTLEALVFLSTRKIFWLICKCKSPFCLQSWLVFRLLKIKLWYFVLREWHVHLLRITNNKVSTDSG